jgi:hypothetical protein
MPFGREYGLPDNISYGDFLVSPDTSTEFTLGFIASDLIVERTRFTALGEVYSILLLISIFLPVPACPFWTTVLKMEKPFRNPAHSGKNFPAVSRRRQPAASRA